VAKKKQIQRHAPERRRLRCAVAAEYDVIIVGVGGMGSAAVYEVARRGQRVLGLERYDIPHELGSSHGVNRIIRLAYFEHPSYVPLLRRAYELWRELERTTGERLLYITGSVDAGAPDSRTVAGSLRSCQIHQLPHEVLDGTELNTRFPGYRLPRDMTAVYQPDGGFVLSERAIVNFVEAAHALGAEVHAREPVSAWEIDGETVVVRTTAAVYRARRLVVTAGPWAAALVPEMQALARAERQVLLWAQPLRPELFRLDIFPVFNLDSPEGHFYGFPVFGVPGFKIGRYHHRGEAVDPDHMNRGCDSDDEAVIREGIRRYFPDGDGPTMAMKTCLFTNSPDEHFIIDVHPAMPHVIVAAGFSGHGFKFCSVVGEILAELALNGETRSDIGLFRVSRFGIQDS
jgi:sarcosine oxidase